LEKIWQDYPPLATDPGLGLPKRKNPASRVAAGLGFCFSFAIESKLSLLRKTKPCRFHDRAFFCAPGMGDSYRVQVPNVP
jgi:hypothetical protein